MATASTYSNQELVTIIEDLGASSSRVVDSEAGIIRGVKLIGLESRNNRRYPAAVLRAAIHHYEGAKVNVNHPASGNPSSPRQYEDRIGVVRNVTAREGVGGGLYGDFHYNPRHGLAEQIAWDAKNAPENVGFSHNALLRMSPIARDGSRTVEEIVSVRSVDLVADPATTRSLYESEIPNMDPNAPAMPAAAPSSSDPLEMIVDSIAQKISEIAKESADPKEKMRQIADLLKKQDKIMTLLGDQKSADAGASGDPAAAAAGGAQEHIALRQQIDKLTATLEGYQKREQQAALEKTIEGELALAGLDPTKHVSDLFAKQLLATESVEDRKAMIADRAALVNVTPVAGTEQQPTNKNPFVGARSAAAYQSATEQINWMSRIRS